MAELSDELRYRLLKILEANPTVSQREIATELGMSLGKVNYCIGALMAKGWVKARNFKNSRSKRAYLYLLTPKGLEERSRAAVRFLRRRVAEIESLREEIASLQAAVQTRASRATRISAIAILDKDRGISST